MGRTFFLCFCAAACFWALSPVSDALALRANVQVHGKLDDSLTNKQTVLTDTADFIKYTWKFTGVGIFNENGKKTFCMAYVQTAKNLFVPTTAYTLGQVSTDYKGPWIPRNDRNDWGHTEEFSAKDWNAASDQVAYNFFSSGYLAMPSAFNTESFWKFGKDLGLTYNGQALRGMPINFIYQLDDTDFNTEKNDCWDDGVRLAVAFDSAKSNTWLACFKVHSTDYLNMGYDDQLGMKLCQRPFMRITGTTASTINTQALALKYWRRCSSLSNCDYPDNPGWDNDMSKRNTIGIYNLKFYLKPVTFTASQLTPTDAVAAA